MNESVWSLFNNIPGVLQLSFKKKTREGFGHCPIYLENDVIDHCFGPMCLGPSSPLGLDALTKKGHISFVNDLQELSKKIFACHCNDQQKHYIDGNPRPKSHLANCPSFTLFIRNGFRFYLFLRTCHCLAPNDS